MYLLILTLFVNNFNGAGSSVNTIKVDSLRQCEDAKRIFLNEMTVTAEELKLSGTQAHSRIVRKAVCVKLETNKW